MKSLNLGMIFVNISPVKLKTLIMKKIFTLLIAILFTVSFLFSQTVVPNFTLTDTQGNSYNLYQELENGKTIVLDFFSLQCGTCQTGIAYMENVWQNYDANGNEVWVWAIETTGAENIDIDDFILSNGGTFPGFSSIENDTLFSFFNITYTPLYFTICPDKTIKSSSVENVEEYVNSCQSTSVELQKEKETDTKIISVISDYDITINYSVSKNSKTVFEIYDLLGNKVAKKTVQSIKGNNKIKFSNWNLTKGYYFIRMTQDNKIVKAKRFIIY